MNKNGISKEELSFYDIGGRLCGMNTSPECLEKLILVFQGVRKHKGAFNVKHFAKIDAFIQKKYGKDSLTLEEPEKAGDEDIDKSEDDVGPIRYSGHTEGDEA